jgi:5'-3' exoribonuclease 1
MGIPKCFRWLAERYPCIVTPYQEQFCPPVDNLYLDMNGLIHPCTHGNTVDASERALAKSEMAVAIFQYVDKLVQLVKPRKNLVLCVDGVAPRAKLNQQRQRRFRAARELRKARELAVERGERVPDMGEVFDSNCITPGTEFMVWLSEQLKYFIRYKIQTDVCWQNCTVTFSGQEVPGEGEHKVMDFIRARKMGAGFDANEVHCLYGLDADLIMLALASHEPNFFLIREEVDFGKTRADMEREANLKEQCALPDASLRRADRFQCLHLALLREYLALELTPTGGGGVEPLDLERMIADFVFLVFLVGNDFLPTIPSLDIREGSLAVLFHLYREHFVRQGSALTDRGVLRWPAVEHLFCLLAANEQQVFEERAANARDYERRQDRYWEARGGNAPDVTVVFTAEGFRATHYATKLHLTDCSPESPEVEQVRLSYLEGLQWNLAYYYQGCCSWKWFYPFHYAPLAADLVDLSCHRRISFQLGEPFDPHLQLLGVLPPASSLLLPPAFRPLMTEATSPIADFYPEEFEIDREFKQADWEGIVRIPFIDELRLVTAYRRVVPSLTEDERRTNLRGSALQFQLSAEVEAPLVAGPAEGFPDIENCRVSVRPFAVPTVPFVAALCLGVALGAGAPEGIPTFATRPGFGSKVQQLGVNVFGMPSRKESRVILTPDAVNPLPTGSRPSAKDTAENLLGCIVWVGWPYHRRAKVVMVADEETLVAGGQNLRCEAHSAEAKLLFAKEAEYHRVVLTQRLALEIGPVHVLVYVRWLTHLARDSHGKPSPSRTDNIACYPLQLVTTDGYTPRPDPRREEHPSGLSSAKKFPVGTAAVYLGSGPDDPKHASPGTVTGHSGSRTIRLAVRLVDRRLLCLPAAIQDATADSTWLTTQKMAERLGLPPKVVGALTGSLQLSPAPRAPVRDIGLRLRFAGRGLARLGYAARHRGSSRETHVDLAHHFHLQSRRERESVGAPPSAVQLPVPPATPFSAERWNGRADREEWRYSPAACDLVAAYCERFPMVAQALWATGAHELQPSRLCIGYAKDRRPEDLVHEIADWVERQAACAAPLVDAGEDTLNSATLSLLEELVAQSLDNRLPPSDVPMEVTKDEIFRPSVQLTDHYRMPVAAPPPVYGPLRLLNRVTIIQPCGSVPFGASGTVVRVLAEGRHVEVLLDEPFWLGSRWDNRLRTPRGLLIPASSLIRFAWVPYTSCLDGAFQAPAETPVASKTSARPPRALSEPVDLGPFANAPPRLKRRGDPEPVVSNTGPSEAPSKPHATATPPPPPPYTPPLPPDPQSTAMLEDFYTPVDWAEVFLLYLHQSSEQRQESQTGAVPTPVSPPPLPSAPASSLSADPIFKALCGLRSAAL